MSGIQVVATLSPKNLTTPTIISELKARPKENRDPVRLGIILGRVRGLSLRSNDYDIVPSVAFTGVFEGVPAIAGKDRIRSAACFLPKMITGTLAATVMGDKPMPIDVAPKRGNHTDVEGLNEIVVALVISIVRDESEVGYRFEVAMHGRDAFLTSDPLAEARVIPGTELPEDDGLPASIAPISARAAIGNPTVPPLAVKPTSDVPKHVAAIHEMHPKAKPGKRKAAR
jgi:hypothetical protein